MTSLSDWLDGYLARSQNVVSAFGQTKGVFGDRLVAAVFGDERNGEQKGDRDEA